MRPGDGGARKAAHAAWRAALQPVLVILGVALPLGFLARVGQYLYYLRPSELLPTYATGWLLLAALSLPLFLLAALALKLLQLGGLHRPRHLLVLLLLWVAAVMAVGPLLLDAVIWLWTFSSHPPAGIKSFVKIGLATASILLALPLAFTHRGRKSLQSLQRTAAFVAVLGGFALFALPFFRWSSAAATPRASDSTTPPPSDAPAPSAKVPSAKPNIILLTIDALSAQHMSLYGAKQLTTPSLDAFARGATVFDRAYANGNFTTAGISSILTGTRPWTHRALEIFSWPIVAARQASLPAVLARAGYQTGYVATNSFAGASRIGLGPYFGFARSDEVPIPVPCPDRLAAVLRYECAAEQLPPLMLVRQIWTGLRASRVVESDNRHYDPTDAIRPALTWLSSVDKSRPVFLWVHLFPPHAPYAAPSPWLGRFDASPQARDANSTDPVEFYAFRALSADRVRLLEARYDEAVLYVDHYAGEFLTEALERLGPDTAVVVTSDHGESFRRDYGGHGGPGLYEPIIHVPLIIKLPHQTDGQRVDALAEQVDIAPTLARLAGIAPPALWEGHSLLALWQAGGARAAAASTPVFAMNFEESPRRGTLTNGSITVIEGRWKLVHYMGRLNYPQMPSLHDELFDVTTDPDETSNRASDEPAEVHHLMALLSAGLARHGGPLP